MSAVDHTSPRDKWLRYNPDKTPADWAELIRRGHEKRELALLDGRALNDEERRKRKARERQRLCRERRRRRETGKGGRMSAEYVFDRHGLAHDASIDLHDYLAVRNALEPRIKERVVRCRDCKYYTDHEWVVATDVEHVCHFWHGEPTKVEPNGFCKWGERRVES